MNLKFLVVIITLVLSTSSALAEGKSKHKAKVNSTAAVKPSSDVKITNTQFFTLAYWTTLGFYEDSFDRTNAVKLRLSKSFVVGCALDLQIFMFKENEKSLDIPTYIKRGVDLINSSIDGIKSKNCNPPTIALAKKVILDPRPFTQIDDIRVDSASLQGSEIMVEGKGNFIMNQFMLRHDTKDLNPVLVNTEDIDVDSKKWILQNCGDMMAPCDVIVNGTVRSGSSPEIIATMIYPSESQ